LGKGQEKIKTAQLRILFITPRLPFPPYKGDKLRSYHFIKNLSKNHIVDLISFIENKKEMQCISRLEEYCHRIYPILLPKHISYLNMTRGILSKRPFQVSYYLSSRMAKTVATVTSDTEYDIVNLVLERMVPHLEHIRQAPIIVDMVDALSLNMERRWKRESNLVKKGLIYWEWKRVKEYEYKNKKIANYYIVTSDVDLKALDYQTIRTISNGVEMEEPSSSKPNRQDMDLIFVGNMGYFPNIDAVSYFCDKVLPKLISLNNKVKFHIVGFNPPPAIKKLDDGKNVFVVGFVEDVREYLKRSKIFVAPMQSGSGIQNKILEAMACGIPVISTSCGNAGIGAKDEKQIVVADNADDFSKKVLWLLDDEQKRNEIGGEGRKLAQKSFSWNSKTEQLVEVYRKVIENYNKE